jgi:hypothetical protein
MIVAKTLSSVTLVVFFEALGGVAGATKNNNEQKLVKWLESVPADRPYLILSKAKIIDLCMQRMTQHAQTFYTSKYLNVLKDMLKSNGAAEHTSGISSAEFTEILLKYMFSAAFMSRLTGDAGAAACIGHHNEQFCLDECIKHSSHENQVFHIKNAYSTGLLKMKSNEFVNASIDYICYAYSTQSV